MHPLIIIGLGITAIGFLAQKLPIAKTVPALQNQSGNGSNGGPNDGEATSDTSRNQPSGDDSGAGGADGTGTPGYRFDLTATPETDSE